MHYDIIPAVLEALPSNETFKNVFYGNIDRPEANIHNKQQQQQQGEQ